MQSFDELDRLLIESSAGIRAPECHGFITGYLCSSQQLDERAWQFMFADLDELPALTADDLAQLEQVGETVNEQLSADDFSFDLLQPDADAPLEERCEALAEWCQGFISGIGVAGLVDWDRLSADCREMIEDLSDICRLQAETQENEQMEVALLELHEYVRAGTVFIHDEFDMFRTDNHNNDRVIH